MVSCTNQSTMSTSKLVLLCLQTLSTMLDNGIVIGVHHHCIAVPSRLYHLQFLLALLPTHLPPICHRQAWTMVILDQ